MTHAMTYSNSSKAHQLRAQFMSEGAMDYWSVIRATLAAMTQDFGMRTRCRSAAQLLPKHGNPAHDLMFRFV